MFTNFRIAFRHLWKNKLFSTINILGLSLGLACCYIILLHVKFELSYDQFHQKKDRIIRVIHESYSYTPIVMATVMPEFFPEIEKIVRVGKYDWAKFYVIENNNFIEEKNFVYADSSFFDIFSFPLLSGDPGRILRSPDKILISESISKKYFGDKNPIGQGINLRITNHTRNFSVEGVFKDFPEESHFHANFLVSMLFFAKDNPTMVDGNWGANSVQTYFLMKDKGMMDQINKRIPDFISKYVPKDNAKDLHYQLQALTRIHLFYNNINDVEPQGNISRVIIFGSIAILVLIIAITNFILLSLSLSYQRIKEFGIRKISGAKTSDLIKLIGLEFLIVFILALMISMMLVEVSIPFLNASLDMKIQSGIFVDSPLLAIFTLIIVFVGYFASSYIAFIVGRFRPIEALKNSQSLNATRIPSWGSLVIFQFIIMIGLLSCLLIMQKQISLLRNKDLGFRKEQLLSINIPGETSFENPAPVEKKANYDRFKKEIGSLAEIQHVSGAAYLPPSNEWWITELKDPLTGEKFRLEEINGDYDMIETMGIQINQGRSFSASFGMDSSSILINETALKLIGLKNPMESYLVRGESDTERSRRKIIGIFKDFHMRSLYQNVQPMVIFLSPGEEKQMIVRLAANSDNSIIHKIEQAYKSIFPDDPIEYSFVGEALQANYIKEDQTNALISLFTFFSILIALMGLFGLSAFSAERRTKEIGIRKVNGASVTEIFLVLSKKFGSWIGIAFIIATPISWYAMHRWLEHFAYKTELSWWVFVLSGIIAVVVALVTISWQSFKAATRNPVEALRYE